MRGANSWLALNRHVVVHEGKSGETHGFIESACRRVPGIASRAHVDESDPLFVEASQGELHQCTCVSATLEMRVHGNHVNNARARVIVLQERNEARDDALAGNDDKRIDIIGQAYTLHVGGLSSAPVRRVEIAEDRGAEELLERDEHWLPGQERQGALLPQGRQD